VGHPQRGSVWQEGPRAAVHVCHVQRYRFKLASFFFFGVSHDRPYVQDWFRTVGGGHLPIPKNFDKTAAAAAVAAARSADGHANAGADAAVGDPGAGGPRDATDRVKYYFPVMAARLKLVPAAPDGATFVSLSSTVWDVVPQVGWRIGVLWLCSTAVQWRCWDGAVAVM